MDQTFRLPAFNPTGEANAIEKFVRDFVAMSRAEGIVIGLSGGVDSSLVAMLCSHALGKDRMLGLLMPTSFTPEPDVHDARQLAVQLGIRTEHVQIDEIVDAYRRALGAREDDEGLKTPLANLRARVRMTILYWFANRYNYLVAGTGDKSEDLIGYFTKYGDGGVDFLPIAHLYKTQVRALAKHLGLPDDLVSKPSSPQLYPGHSALDEIPADYDVLDPILYALFEQKLSPAEVQRELNAPKKLLDEVLRRHQETAHKRAYPPLISPW